MESHRADVLGVAPEVLDLLHHPDIEDSDTLVSRSACHHIAIGRPAHCLNRVLVVVQCAEIRTGSGIPKFDQVVLAARHKQTLGRMPLHTSHIVPMPGQALFHFSPLEVPYLDATIVTSGTKALVVWCERDIPYRFTVTVEQGDVVHIWLEILDNASIVAGYKPGARVGPFCSSYGVVVRL